jgi:NAD(P)-dependent dehydrogenase (short-subunit alcohol dehydrogenase family)
MRLNDKKAIVTGAGQGIGRAIAIKLAQEGADVAIAEINPDTGTQTTKKIETIGRKTLFLPVDVADRKQVKETVIQVLTAWGRIDILVNNAGFDRGASLLKIKEDWDEDWGSLRNLNTSKGGSTHD